MTNKIVRTICYFTKGLSGAEEKLDAIPKKFKNADFEVQTKRICSPQESFRDLEQQIKEKDLLLIPIG